MKVAFVKPPVGGILGLEMLTFVEPLGPICVAACLEAEGHECKVVRPAHRRRRARPRRSARSFAPDVVGLQCNFTTERNRTVRLAKRIKRENPGTFVVVGGHDASRDPNWFNDDVIDAVAVGDGEEVMPPMVDALQRGHDLRHRSRPDAASRRDAGSAPATRRRARTSTTIRCRRGISSSTTPITTTSTSASRWR